MAEPVRARRLTDQEGRRLLQIVRRGKHGSVRVRRAMIIMASASGTLVPAIARLVAADEDTVRDVIHAFNAKGLAALDPRWAGGRPRLISDAKLDRIEYVTSAYPTVASPSTSPGRCRSGPATACAGRRANGRPGCARLITAPTASAASMAATAWAMTSCGASLASIRAPITPWPR